MGLDLLNSNLRPVPDTGKLEKIKSWVRHILQLDKTCLVAVSEDACDCEDCSTLQTSIIVSPAPKEYWTFIVRKPLNEVTRMDVIDALTHPPAP